MPASFSTPPLSVQLRERITDEIFFALGFQRTGLTRRILGSLFRRPAARFGRIFSQLEEEVPRSGLPGGARRLLPDFSLQPHIRGLENFPAQGPVLVVSNHPGAYDSLAITASIPRSDLKIAVSDVPFLRSLTETARRFIFIPTDPVERMAALKACISHLRQGGALLIFAHGEVEPDPEIMTGAYEAIAEWSRSIEIILRKVPNANYQPVIASGVLLPAYVHHPLVRLRKQPYHRQKLAEVLQILRQMVFPSAVQVNVHISFGRPLRADALPAAEIMPAAIQAARDLLQEHMGAISLERGLSPEPHF